MTHPLLPNAQEAVLSATWGADAHSASSPEGLVRLAPLEIAPLPQQMPSGIVRSQVLESPSRQVIFFSNEAQRAVLLRRWRLQHLLRIMQRLPFCICNTTYSPVWRRLR